MEGVLAHRHLQQARPGVAAHRARHLVGPVLRWRLALTGAAIAGLSLTAAIQFSGVVNELTDELFPDHGLRRAGLEFLAVCGFLVGIYVLALHRDRLEGQQHLEEGGAQPPAPLSGKSTGGQACARHSHSSCCPSVAPLGSTGGTYT